MPGVRSGWYASLLIGWSIAASAWAQAPAEEAPASPPSAEPQPVPALPAVPAAPAAPVAPGPTAPVAQPAAPAAPAPAAPTPAPAAGAAAPVAQPSPAAPPATAAEEEEPEKAAPEPPGPVTVPEKTTESTQIEAELSLDETTAEPSDDKDDGLPWFASVEWAQSYGAAGITRGGEPSFNPEYVWDFMARVGYRFDPLTSIALRQPLTIELTDSDSTASRQELWLLDTTIDLTRKLWKNELRPGTAFDLRGSVGVALPLSPSSQAAHVIFGGRANLGLDFSEKRVLQGLSAGTGVAFVHRFATSNVAQSDTPFACITGDADISHSCSALGGATTTRDSLRLDLHGEIRPLERLGISASYAHAWIRGHGLMEYDQPLETGGTVHLGDEQTHFRNSNEIMIGVGYDFADWFSAQLYTSNSFRDRGGPDSNLRAPFKTVDTAFGLSLTFSVDQLVLAQRGAETTPVSQPGGD